MTATDDSTWLDWRQAGIGASDVAAAATGSYGGLYRVVADKLGIPHDNTIDPALAARGHRWEPRIADAVHALTGWYVHGEQLLVEAPSDPRHRCTLDGLIDPRPQIGGLDDAAATLEVKTKGVNGPNKQDYYNAQIQWQLHCTNKTRALLAVAVIDDVDDACMHLYPRWIERDDSMIAQLVDIADHALLCVEAQELPDPDAATDLELVRTVNADADHDIPGPPVDDLDDDMARWLVVKAAAKALETERKQLEAKFRHHMGEAIVGQSGRYRLRVGDPVQKFTRDSETDALDLFPQYAKTVLDRAAFKANEPDLYDALKRPTNDRRITVKELDQ